MPPSALFRTGEGLDTLPERTASLTYPLFVKPARAGSSFGITKVEEPGVLAEAVTAALAHDSKVVIEEAVPGFEVGCAVLGSEELTVGLVDEIQLSAAVQVELTALIAHHDAQGVDDLDGLLCGDCGRGSRSCRGPTWAWPSVLAPTWPSRAPTSC